MEQPQPDWLRDLESLIPLTQDDDDPSIRDPSVSPEEYLRQRRVEIGKWACQRKRLYLDQRYWIQCRDASMGNPAETVDAEIWSLLSDGVANDLYICPASYPVLKETLRIGDSIKRNATAKMIDVLSKQIVIQSMASLIPKELYHFLCRYGTKGTVAPLEQLAWTCPSYVLGDGYPQTKELPHDQALVLTKSFIRFSYRIPFATLIKALSEDQAPRPNGQAHADALNRETRAHHHEVTSFEAVFQSEIAGVLDACKDDIVRACSAIFTEQTGGPPIALDSPEAKESSRQFSNLIYHAYRLGRLKHEIPFVFIGASIHAYLRYRQQAYQRGDYWDHKHAHAALAYCDAFFTERALGNVLTSRDIQLDSAFNTKVLWNRDDVVGYLRSLR